MKVRITDSGHSEIKVPGEEACYHLFHIGVVDNTGRHGVAIALSGAAQAAIRAWVTISSRLPSARLKRTTVNLTVIPCYVPTLDAAEEKKYPFYDDVHDAVGGVPAGNMLIVTGDWNARPGPVDTATWHILDKFAVGTGWANGDHLVNFASANRIVVSSTRF